MANIAECPICHRKHFGGKKQVQISWLLGIVLGVKKLNKKKWVRISPKPFTLLWRERPGYGIFIYLSYITINLKVVGLHTNSSDRYF